MDRLYPVAEVDDDAIDELLASLRVRSTMYCHSEMRAPWGFAVAASDMCAFHIVLDGSCWADVDGGDGPIRLDPGDVVLLLTGRTHRVRDGPTSEAVWLDDILARNPPGQGKLSYGGAGPRTELACGGFLVEGSQASPLLMSLPPLLRLQSSDPAAHWLTGVLELLKEELSRLRPGSGAVLAALTDVMVTQVIRGHLLSPGKLGPVSACRTSGCTDRQGHRLAHADPVRAWTVDELATEVAMSRSAFAATFRQLTGVSPMRYVIRCRLGRAASCLSDGGLSVAEIARRTGYDSESAFTKAFTRQFGMPPSAYRRSLQEQSGVIPATREVD